MATIIGAVATSHIPGIGIALARQQQSEPYWKPFFDGYPPVNAWLERMRPDVAVVIYNDHGLNFFLDKMPTFAIGAAAEYRNADEGWGLGPQQLHRNDEAMIDQHLLAGGQIEFLRHQ